MKIKFALGMMVLLLSACGSDNNQAQTPATDSQPNNSSQAQTVTSTSDIASQEQKTDNANMENPALETGEQPKLSKESVATKSDVALQAAYNPSPEVLKLGQTRYDATCKICHEQGLLDAPKLGDKANWIKRQEQGLEVLYTHSIKGFKKMPAQAVNGVSEDEVKAAVDFMLSQAR